MKKVTPKLTIMVKGEEACKEVLRLLQPYFAKNPILSMEIDGRKVEK